MESSDSESSSPTTRVETTLCDTVTVVSEICQLSNQRIRESVNNLCRFCSENLPNRLTLILLKIYKCPIVEPTFQSQSLALLLSHLNHLYDARIQLDTRAFRNIKPLLASCLLAQGTREDNFKILSRIASLVALDVFLTGNTWDDLWDCIAALSEHNIGRALYVFINLPMVLDEDSLTAMVRRLFPLILRCLVSRRSSGAEEWILALEAGFVVATQLVNARRSDLAEHFVYAVLSSSCELVRNGEEATIRRGMWRLTHRLNDEARRIRDREYSFLLSFASRMEGMNGIRRDTIVAATIFLLTLGEKIR